MGRRYTYVKAQEIGLALHSDSCNLLFAARFLILSLSVGVSQDLFSFFASLKEKQCLTYVEKDKR